MNAHIYALREERDQLLAMRARLAAGAPIELVVDQHQVGQPALEKVRWGIYGGIGARLLELGRLISQAEEEAQ